MSHLQARASPLSGAGGTGGSELAAGDPGDMGQASSLGTTHRDPEPGLRPPKPRSGPALRSCCWGLGGGVSAGP